MLLRGLALFFSLSYSIAVFAEQEIAGQPRVIDGDSLQIGGSRIRLAGIDAPEMGQQCRIALEKQNCGELSKDHLAALIGKSQIRCKWSRFDRYDRLLGTCFIGDSDINAELVKQGMALAYRRYTDKYVPQEEIARRAGVGLWSLKFVPPWDWRKGVRLDALGDNR